MSFSLRFGEAAAQVLSDETVFQGHFAMRRLSLRHRLFAGGWSGELTREVFERGDAVGVLPYDPVSDTLILIEQFRPGAIRDGCSPWGLELVAGVVEPGESDADLVHREASEEAACELAQLEHIASFYTSPGACSEQLRLYCGRVISAGVGEVHGLESEGEDILVHRLPRSEAMQLLQRGEVANGQLLVALQWLALNGEVLRQRWLDHE